MLVDAVDITNNAIECVEAILDRMRDLHEILSELHHSPQQYIRDMEYWYRGKLSGAQDIMLKIDDTLKADEDDSWEDDDFD